MFFEKNKSEKLDENLFKNPTAEYRGAPFWSWNTKLKKGDLEKHIDAFEKMGLGGFNMHARVGLGTEYLGEEFMEMVKFCTGKAKEKGLYAWLYDEDKWPSGFAGGKATKDPYYRQRFVNFTVNKTESTKSQEEFEKEGTPLLLACYDICLDDDGFLKSYDIIDEDAEPNGRKWYAYASVAESIVWFNGGTYLDSLDKVSTEKFIECTHEEYKKAIGDEFGKAVPYIFTDEPRAQLTEDFYNNPIGFSTDTTDVHIMWSKKFAEIYEKTYGESIIPEIPELIWQKPGDELHTVRYKYYRLVAELFNENFMKPYGDWCKKNNLGFTGHMMCEDDLGSQAMGFGGEIMPAYKHMDVPGVDILCAFKNFVTAKQCQSVVRQMGKEGMLSELYGVTSWKFDFRGHKIEGDWQAALGVTHRVHHLTYLTMEGAAKRDYPASIGYQSPWYGKYSYVEDHFARLGTVLSRGKAIVKVAVIHPIESYWLKIGAQDKTSVAKKSMEQNFASLTKDLITGNVDFDFISETMLPELCESGSNPLKVGEMAYDVVILSGSETIRKSTVERLSSFAKAGGKIIVVGSVPKFIDLKEDKQLDELLAMSKKVSTDPAEIFAELEENILVEIYNEKGEKTEDIIHQLREDGDVKWLFCAHTHVQKSLPCAHTYLKECVDVAVPERLLIKVKGEYYPVLYNTVTGEKEQLDFEVKNGWTLINKTIFAYDSLLISLEKATKSSNKISEIKREIIKTTDFRNKLDYKLSEPNALMLDKAEYSLDGEPFCDEEEILRISVKLRDRLGWPSDGSSILQPWLIKEEPAEHTLALRTSFESEIAVKDALLAVETPEKLSIKFNGKAVVTKPVGYFVDESIKTLKLPTIKKGKNVLEITMPFDKLTFPEWMYILGEFGVKVCGAAATICKKPEKIGFSSLTEQNMPFYTGNVNYCADIDVPECENVKVKISSYRGGLTEVIVDGKESGLIVYPPYNLDLGKLSAGKHKFEFKVYGNRENAFGPVHNFDSSQMWIGPGAWFTKDDSFGYEYKLTELGILKSPVITFEK